MVNVRRLAGIAARDRGRARTAGSGVGVVTDHEQKQAAYAAKRKHATRLEQVPMVDYRVQFRDGREVIERVIGLSEVAAYHPDAVQITRCDWGGFY